MEDLNVSSLLAPNVDIVKENITLDRSIGKEITQILLEDDIIVPDIKPDMSLILQSDANIVIEKVEPSIDRINVVGKLNISLLYLAKNNENPVHSISVVHSIDDFINMEEVTKDSILNLKADIANIDYNMINDRKINYRAVLDIHISGTVQDNVLAVVSLNGLPKSQQQQNTISLSKNVAVRNDRFSIKEDISIPVGKPNILEILTTSIEIRNQNVRATDGNVQITGDLNLTILYRGDDNGPLDFYEIDIPFTGTVEIEEATDEMFADAILNVLDKYIQVRQNDDGEDRIVELEVTVGVTAKISTKENLEFLEDAYSTTNHLNIDTAGIYYPRFVFRNKSQSNIKEIVTMPQSNPGIVQVFRVKGKAYIHDLKIITDKIIVEGAIELDILYIAKNDDIPLFSHKTDVPYRQVIEAASVNNGMEANIDVNIDGIHFNMLSENEIELRISATFNLFVSETMQAKLIQDIEVEELDPDFLNNMGSITVYVVGKGDTLWKIAKRYHTSVEEIVELNNIVNPDMLNIGQKLIILKKTV